MPRSTATKHAPPEAVFVSLQDASVRVAVSVDALRDEIARGRLPAYRFGNGRGRIRVKIADLDRLMRPIPTLATSR